MFVPNVFGYKKKIIVRLNLYIGSSFGHVGSKAQFGRYQVSIDLVTRAVAVVNNKISNASILSLS